MKTNLNIWQELYAIVQQWNNLQPWKYIDSADWIKIKFENKESIYCTIMGQANNCIGLSMYFGDEGYRDLSSLSIEPIDDTVMKYLMYDQTCLTFYMGDREEVPSQQKKIIKELGLKFRGRGNWPYFISYKKRFFPYHIDDDQAQLITKVMKKLIDIVKAYINQEIDVRFEEDEIINAFQDNNQWTYEPLCLPEQINKFTPVEIEDEKILQQITLAPSNHHGLIVDLVYLNMSSYDNNHSRPINPLLFIVLDEESQMVIGGHMLDPEDDEIGFVLSFLADYILQEGKPDRIFVRNPAVWSAMIDICEESNIELIITPLQMIDFMIEDMSNSLID